MLLLTMSKATLLVRGSELQPTVLNVLGGPLDYIWNYLKPKMLGTPVRVILIIWIN